jgi:recombinational DNA repair ATPase RecF
LFTGSDEAEQRGRAFEGPQRDDLAERINGREVARVSYDG